MAVVEKDGPAAAQHDNSSEVRLLLGREEDGVHEVLVDREALKQVSPFFRCMLSHDMVECKEGRVRLDYVTPDSWRVISAFYFSQERLVTLDNVEEMVALCEMLGMTALKDCCDDFLCRHAGSLEDLMKALKWATSCQLNKLKEFLLKIIRKAFEDISQADSFLRLERSVLLEILSGSYVIGSEDAVCEAVLRWLEAHDSDSETVEQMFQHVNLNLVCLACLKKQVRESRNAAVKKVVFEMVDRETLRREEGQWPYALEIHFLIQRDCSSGFSQVFPDKYGIPFDKPCKCKPARNRPFRSKSGKWTPADDGNLLYEDQACTPAEDEDSSAKRSRWRATDNEETDTAPMSLEVWQADQQDLSTKACKSAVEDKSLCSTDDNVCSKASFGTPGEGASPPSRGAGWNPGEDGNAASRGAEWRPAEEETVPSAVEEKDTVVTVFTSGERFYHENYKVDRAMRVEAKIPGQWQSRFRACLFDGYFVMIGTGNYTQMFHLKTSVWKRCPPLLERCTYYALVSCEDAMYAVLGDKSGTSNSVEVFSKEGMAWELAGDMQRGTWCVEAGIVRDLIIAAGQSYKGLVLQSYNRVTGVSLVLEQSSVFHQLDLAFSMGSRSVVFVDRESYTCVEVRREEEVSITRGQLPDLREVFAMDWEAGDEEQGGMKGLLDRVSRLSLDSPCPYFVQCTLGRQRVNLTPLNTWSRGFITNIYGE